MIRIKFTTEIDVFFGGGEYDHGKLARMGMTVPPWPADEKPTELLEFIPEKIAGETWRTDTLYGNAVSTFGICYNLDRLEELGLDPPRHWVDLTHPKYAGFVGVADPTKSGSISKAFEMMVHQQIFESLKAAGLEDQIVESEKKDATRSGPYDEAVAAGWLKGIRLIQRIGANARYWTDSSSKVPVDVGAGDAAAGLAIDFYGRFQSEIDKRMSYVTPEGRQQCFGRSGIAHARRPQPESWGPLYRICPRRDGAETVGVQGWVSRAGRKSLPCGGCQCVAISIRGTRITPNT